MAKTDLDKFKKIFNKTFGEDAVHMASEVKTYKGQVIDFPSVSLGDASHFWGIPLGAVTQFHGPEGSGKTFMAMLEVKQAQEQYPDSVAIWFDAEFSFQPKWAAKIGIDLERLLIIEGNNAAEIFTRLCGRTNDKGKYVDEGILQHIQNGNLNCKLIVLDSIANLIYPIEENREFGQHEMAAGARFLQRGMKMALPLLAQTGTAFLCINQAREKIGERIPTLTYPGGRPYRHALSLAILFMPSMAKDGTLLDESEHKLGHRISAKVEKTRAGADKWRCEFWFDFKKGIVNTEAEYVMLGAAYGVIARPSGNWYEYGGIKANGKDAFAKALGARPDLLKEILDKVKAAKEAGADRPEELNDSPEVISDFLNEGEQEDFE